MIQNTKVTKEDAERYKIAQDKIDVSMQAYTSEVAAACFSVLDKRIQEFGILTEGPEVYSNSYRGGAFAKTIDFEDNKLPNLYIIYRDGTDVNYIEELWGYKDGNAIRIASDVKYAQGLVTDLTIAIVKGESKTYIA